MLSSEKLEVKVVFCHDCFLSEIQVPPLRAQNCLVRNACTNPSTPSVTFERLKSDLSLPQLLLQFLLVV